jgi:hypothetical protein
LEDARVPASSLSGKNVGVYVGAFSNDFDVINRQGDNFNSYDQFTATSSTFTMLSNRLSYSFNFRGLYLTIDTACSASMVAFNYACQDLRAGNAEVAIVAGVNAMLYPSSSTVMSVGGFLSPDSRSKIFDAKANGYARGEGAGAILVKRLSDAFKDGNEIYTVVKGSGLNQDGKTIGIAAPSEHAKQKLIERVLAGLVLSVICFANAELIQNDITGNSDNISGNGFIQLDEANIIAGNDLTSFITDWSFQWVCAGVGYSVSSTTGVLDMTSFFVVDLSRNVVSTNICAISVGAVCANTDHEAFFATTTFLQRTTTLSSFESGLVSLSGPTSEPEPSTLDIFALGIMGLASRPY